MKVCNCQKQANNGVFAIILYELRACARCHSTEKDCSCKDIARECQQDRVLLSTHMEKHWQEVGFTPETSTVLGDDIELDIDVQIGQDSMKSVMQSGPDLTQRYTAIMVSGLSAEQNLSDIHTLLVSKGLPDTVKCTDILKNERSGKLTIENLGPADCMSLMENMHGKKFLGKKVFITPIVSASPVKAKPASDVSSSSSSGLPAAPVSARPGPSPSSAPVPPAPPPPTSAKSTVKIKLKTTRNLKPTSTKLCLVPVVIVQPPEKIPDLVPSSGSGSDSGSDSGSEHDGAKGGATPVSPSIQDKIDIFDPTATSSRRTSVSEKRKHIESPEKTDMSLLTKAEIRSLRKKNKRLKKLKHQEAEKNLLKSDGQ